MSIDYDKLNDIAISVIENDKFHKLISSIVDKGFWDYAIPLVSIIVAGISIFLAHKTFNAKLSEVKGEQIMLKDIDKIYEAAHALFLYSDSAGLFFSMMNIKSKRIKTSTPDDEAFPVQFKKADENYFNNISKIHEAIFIFKTLGNIGIANKLEELHKYVISNRKRQMEIIRNYNGSNSSPLDEITVNYESLINDFSSKRDSCLSEISSFKKSYK